MGTQILLLNLGEFQIAGIKKEEKRNTTRIRYDVVTYEKFYSFYRYDRLKFRAVLNAQNQTLFFLFIFIISVRVPKFLFLCNLRWAPINETLLKNIEFPEDVCYFTQDEILDFCYVLDENGNKLKYPDELHILRLKTLFEIYNRIGLIIWGKMREFTNNDGLYDIDGLTLSIYHLEQDEWVENGVKFRVPAVTYHEGYIPDTEMLSIKDRLKIHIKLLRLLKQGLEVKDAIEIVKGEC